MGPFGIGPPDVAQVEVHHRRGDERPDRLGERVRHPERVCEVVARPEGEHAERHAGPGDPVDRLVDRPVAARDHDGVHARGLTGEPLHLPGSRRLHDLRLGSGFGEGGLQKSSRASGPPIAGGGVEKDEETHGQGVSPVT